MARIFDVQRFSIHDGPGIRTTLFMKGCSLRCAWCQNPEGLEPRPRLWHFQNLCCRSERCLAACPLGAITVRDGVLAIDHRACDGCGKCVEACPTEALAFDGQELGVDEAVSRLAADKKFYDRSGGGVTFSGGEALLQAEFVEEVAGRLKAQAIHTAVETALHVPWAAIVRLLPVIDLFIADLKIADPEAHFAATGAGNARILDNLARLASALAGTGRLWIRVPVVPGCTDGQGNLAAIARLIAGFDRTVPVELMNFNPLAAPKYARMGRAGFPAQARRWTDAEMAGFQQPFRAAGLSLR